ncbi:MAG: ABC transporter substrate-binding protein [Alphaproteobacteria bacterium]|nr:ABC transporter substrate-binding protein [Alphaproteobacteria bacterium]
MTIQGKRLLAACAVAAFGIAIGFGKPADAQQKVLRFIPHANLSSIDPITTTGYIVRNHGYLVYDTLFATDANFKIQPQMVDKWTTSPDKLRWEFTLRDGLKFHDGAPVRPADVIASVKRWSARDTFGQAMAATVDSYEAIGDKTFAIKLKKPFPLMLEALGKLSSNVPFIMPERIANTDPAQNITDATGSGPFRFVRSEWVPGQKAVYERFADYKPRSEPPSWAAGGKVVKIDRLEFRIIPDPAVASAALGAGEVDWYEQPPVDLLPTMARNKDIKIELIDPLGSMAMLRFNHLHPPFNNPAVRRAVMMAVNQNDYLQAIIGNKEYYKVCKSFFTCGTPMASDVGIENAAGDLNKAKQMLKESGYKGEKVVIISPTDIPTNHLQSLVTEDLLKKLGMNVELVATDWGSVLARRASKNPPDQGGWSIFHTWWVGPDVVNPALHAPLRGNGAASWPGWPTDATMEALREKWLVAPTPAEQVSIAKEMQARAYEMVPYVTTGQFQQPTAFRTSISGIIVSPVPFFWNVEKR